MIKFASVKPTELNAYLGTLFAQQLAEQVGDYSRAVGEVIGIGAFDRDKLIGGLLMTRRYDHLYINRLALASTYRHQRLGTQLITAAEAWARDHQIINITLSTRDYQAVGFYQKCGYQVYGQIADLPFAGVTTFYFVKRLNW
ncbi:GNAT family N-acetyltransferase [Lactiplantibacillus fabifermentans]|uniref:N-acetyltransferase domain-containing protein n=2 Tax=Lactiplantibacillus fabifermentans TaxID=483011 RepID=A0A0R2NRF3_9LACO|nr:GNAT family N-acetyltransferase [Lactiplantibacillus fabifermentans]KRO28254.1 hypothetical protein DY78_GL002490 [Lactiplantibacillus fabifermentans DSM 21115]